MSSLKCNSCESTNIEVDPSRGNAVCTNCGCVLEEGMLVSEVQFEENAVGGSNVIGQFVSADFAGVQGSSSRYGRMDPRKITIRKAKQGMATLLSLMRLPDHLNDQCVRYYEQALNKKITKGHPAVYAHAACVYLTCRQRQLPWLLIDISDMVNICCYRLGRLCSRVVKVLQLSLEEEDPSWFVTKFAHKLEFGNKTDDVAKTAAHLVKRMKRDYIHIGRKVAGVCGAALLMAARWHNFNRTTSDVVKIVKIHESTLRKRLMEFGDTPSSALTLDEFMDVNLEKEEDPPSFKTARKKEKEKIHKLMTEEENTFTELKLQIEKELDLASIKRKRPLKDLVGSWKNFDSELEDENRFIAEATHNTIKDIMDGNILDDLDDPAEGIEPIELGPNYASMDLPSSLFDKATVPINTPTTDFDGDVNFDDIDDTELDQYLLTEREAKEKEQMWKELNADYLEQERIKEEKEKEMGGKPEKKRRTAVRKKANTAPYSTAFEAIEKMLQEKKFSSKINYEVLKSLSSNCGEQTEDSQSENSESSNALKENSNVLDKYVFTRPTATPKRKLNQVPKINSAVKAEPKVDSKIAITEKPVDKPLAVEEVDEDCDDYYDDDISQQADNNDEIPDDDDDYCADGDCF